MNTITFQATIGKVQTLVDMGLRVTLDLPEDAVMQAAQLMECRRDSGWSALYNSIGRLAKAG